MPTGADLLVDCLYRHGIRRVFGMPGSHSTHIYDAIHRRRGIETILCRNEQAGAYMADGCARVTGCPAVLCTTAGPGATNALSGIAEANSDSSPVLLLAGQVNHDRLHELCGRYHEIDLDGIFRPATRFTATIMANDRIPEAVDRAISAMVSGRPGSAALILPQDLMAMQTASPASATSAELSRIAPPEEPVRRARELILASQRPVIVAGGGAVSSGASDEIERLAVNLGCPVITTLNGKGIIDERSPLSLGHGRSRRARLALSRADLMLAAGCRFNEVFTASATMPMPKTLIQIDIEAAPIGVNYPVTLGIVADARTALRAMLKEMPPRDGAEWKKNWHRFSQAEQLKPEWLIETLRAAIPEGAIVFADASEMGLKMQTDFAAHAAGTFFYPSNFAALGWGFPAAVGGAIGRPDRWIISMNGDGGFLMAAQELATAVRYRLKMIVIVHNDSTYGAIKNLQQTRHEGRFCDTDLNNPDFLKFAESFGLPATRARDAGELSAAIAKALQRDGPSFIEVPDEWRTLRLS
jgi:acetolactate synthase-1/2/3 large subunit